MPDYAVVDSGDIVINIIDADASFDVGAGNIKVLYDPLMAEPPHIGLAYFPLTNEFEQPNFGVATLDPIAEGLWVNIELGSADNVILEFQDGYIPAPPSTEAAWRTYRNELRNHVIGGVVQGARPVRPA